MLIKEDSYSFILIFVLSFVTQIAWYSTNVDIFYFVLPLLLLFYFVFIFRSIIRKYDNTENLNAAQFMKILICLFLLGICVYFIIKDRRSIINSFDVTHAIILNILGFSLFLGLCIAFFEGIVFLLKLWSLKNGNR
jgi:hypothetical protein